MITIGSQTYGGKNVTIINNKVFVDGKDVSPDAKEINIEITGDLDTLEVDYAKSIKITGNVNKIRSGSGDVNCNAVNQGIQTGSGDVECSNVTGDIQTGSGDVNANNVSGSVRTGSGDIKYKKN